MEEMIKENKKFRTTINGEIYSCYINPPKNFGMIHFLVIKNIKYFLKFPYINWKYKYWIKTSRNSFNHHIEHKIINGKNYYNISDVKYWVDDAIYDYNLNIEKIEKENIKEKNIIHKNVI